MKVKVGNKTYDGEKEPIMVILTQQDRENINSMPKGNKHYCVYPSLKKWTDNNYKKIKDWMKDHE